MSDFYKDCNIKEAHIFNFIDEYSFAPVVTNGDDIHKLCQLPFFVDFDTNNTQPKLYFHLSKTNYQYESIQKNNQVSCLFSGPYSYISPSWYPKPKKPTWNFKSVLIVGTAHLVVGDDALTILAKKITHFEKKNENHQFTIEMATQLMKNQLDEIALYELDIKNVKANFELSQQEDEKTFLGLIRELKKQDNYNSMLVAFEMEQELRKKKMTKT